MRLNPKIPTRVIVYSAADDSKIKDYSSIFKNLKEVQQALRPLSFKRDLKVEVGNGDNWKAFRIKGIW